MKINELSDNVCQKTINSVVRGHYYNNNRMWTIRNTMYDMFRYIFTFWGRAK